MYTKFRKFIHNKHHDYDEICETTLYKNRLDKSVFFILILIAAFSLNVIISYLFFKEVVPGVVAINIFQVYFVIGAVIGFFVLPYHPRNYGFNTNRLKFNLLTSLPIGFAGMLIAFALRWFISQNGYPEFGFYFDPVSITTRFIFYPFFCIVQEIITRGYLQSFFMAVFDDQPYKKSLSITISSLVFAQFHILFGLPVFVGTFVFSYLIGLYYEKSRSLVGVTIIHFLCGFGLLFFSNSY